MQPPALLHHKHRPNILSARNDSDNFMPSEQLKLAQILRLTTYLAILDIFALTNKVHYFAPGEHYS